MTYRIDDLEVPPGNPFQYDSLKRKPLVEFLTRLIGRLDGPFVMALDSPFGSGKTTLVRMLIETLKSTGHPCIYFNAWKVDYATDPLVALVSSIDRIDLGTKQEIERYRKHLTSIKKVTTLLAKQSVIAGVKGLTSGLVDLDEIVRAVSPDSTSDAKGDIVKEFNQERDLLDKFRKELEKAVKLLPTVGETSGNLVFFIDELDRCRPTFAIQLLERIKHLFDVPNIIFVLSIDKKQIEASTKAVYGAEIDATEYLRRFFDLEYSIPVVDTERYTGSLITRFDLDSAFVERTKNPPTAYDRKQFVEFFTLLSETMELTLRAQERCITRLRIVMDETSSNQYLDPILVALLIVLRSNQPVLYNRFIRGEASPDDVMKSLTRLPRWKISKTDRSEKIIHAYLLLADTDRDRANQRNDELESATQTGNDKYASSLIQMKRTILGHHRLEVSLTEIAKKIDLVSRVRE